MVHLLVIAPNSPFRSSLRFALEAEGYEVTAVASIADVHQPPSSFACTVLDHHGLDGEASGHRQFVAAFDPVVLLANNANHPMAPLSFRTLTKPSLGPVLSAAVRAAITARQVT